MNLAGNSHEMPSLIFSEKVHLSQKTEFDISWESSIVCLFVLRFYGPVNPMGSCRARSVYLTTRLLGRLCPLSG